MDAITAKHADHVLDWYNRNVENGTYCDEEITLEFGFTEEEQLQILRDDRDRMLELILEARTHHEPHCGCGRCGR